MEITYEAARYASLKPSVSDRPKTHHVEKRLEQPTKLEENSSLFLRSFVIKDYACIQTR